jgi:hypothetical protein
MKRLKAATWLIIPLALLALSFQVTTVKTALAKETSIEELLKQDSQQTPGKLKGQEEGKPSDLETPEAPESAESPEAPESAPQEPEESPQEGGNPVSEYFKNFDNLKLLITMTFPIATLFAAGSAIEGVINGRLKQVEVLVNRLNEERSRAARAVEALKTSINELSKLRSKLRSELGELLTNKGRILVPPIEALIEKKKRLLERLAQVENELTSKFIKRRES